MFENLKKIFGIPIIISLALWVLFNNYVFCSDSIFISNATHQINDFCSGLNLSYYFLNKDILGLFRFLEYSVFGVVTISVFRIYFKSICQNAMNSMFLGLLVAVLEVYHRSFGVYRLEIQDVLYSFFEFCVGVSIIFIFAVAKPKKRFLLKHRKNNYIGRS